MVGEEGLGGLFVVCGSESPGRRAWRRAWHGGRGGM